MKSKKRTIGILIVVIVVLLGFAGSLLVYRNKLSSDNVNNKSDHNIAQSLSSAPSGKSIENFYDKPITDEKIALDSIEVNRNKLGYSDKNFTFIYDKKSGSETAYHFDLYYKGIPVYSPVGIRGVSVITHYDKRANVLITGVSDSEKITKVNITPKITKDEATEIAKKTMNTNSDIELELILYEINESYTLAYYYCGLQVCIINAETGEVIKYYDAFRSNIDELIGQNGDVHQVFYDNYTDGNFDIKNALWEKEKNIFVHNNISSKEEIKNNDKLLTIDDLQLGKNKSAIDGMANTYRAVEYFERHFDKKFDSTHISVNVDTLKDKDGNVIKDNACGGYLNLEGNNVAYLFFPFTSNKKALQYSAYLDIVAHEFTHAITVSEVFGSYSKDDSKYYECNALGEAYSDIFGQLIEQEYTGQTDWKQNLTSDSYRDLAKKEKNKEYKYKYNERYTGANDDGGAHYNSTIISHTAYLMSKDNYNNDKNYDTEFLLDYNQLGQLWYGSLAYLKKTEFKDFADCRWAVEQSARDLIEKGVLLEDNLKVIEQAFNEVEVSSNPIRRGMKDSTEIIKDKNTIVVPIEDETQSSAPVEIEETKNYEWHLEPTIEADNIIVPDYDNELYEKYAIIEKNGKYGLISNKGELIEDIKYNDFLICPLNIYVIGNGDVSDFELNNKENIGYKIENEKLIKTNHIGHGTGDITYYYYNINDNKVYKVAQIGDNCEEYRSDNVVLARCVSMNIKENGICSCSDIFDEFYLVNGNGKINDTKYDDGNSYYSIQSHNIICAKKDNKWFYFNNKGDKIIFDNVKSSYMINGGHVETNRLNNNNIVNYPFLDVDNIIAVNTPNGGCFYDIEGIQLISSDEFEEVRPIINGFAWVKKDGKWGVIKLKYDNQIEELNSWQTLYSQYLLNGEYKQLGTGFANGNTGEEYTLTDKDAKFQLVYIDNDDIPELIISGGYSIHIITVKDDELIQLKKDDNNGNFAWYGCLEYREREGFFLDDYQRMGVYKTPVYKLQDGECLLQDNIEYYESYESGEISHQSFIINNEEVSLDKYVNVLKKWRLNTYFTEQHSEYNIENDNWKDLNYTDGYEITESNIKIITNYGEKSDGKLITDIKSKSKNNQKNKGIVTIEDGYLNVRETPSTKGKIIGKLYNGDKITIEETSEDGKWYKISKDDIKGYVSKDYVKTN